MKTSSVELKRDRNNLYRVVDKRTGRELLVSEDWAKADIFKREYDWQFVKWTNKVFVRLFNRHEFHIRNYTWLRKIVRRVFDVRKVRGRGPRVHGGKRYFRDLPLRYAKNLHIYLYDN